MFSERALLILQYVAHKEMKKAKYHDMQRSDVIEFVSKSSSKTLDDMVARATQRERERGRLNW